MENLHIGQIVFIVCDNDLLKRKINSIYKTRYGTIEGSLEWKDYDDRNTQFEISDSGEMKGSHTYAYNRNASFISFLTIQEASEYKRKSVLEDNFKLRENVENAMGKLKEFRKKHFEILNSTDVDEWIKNFEREYSW